MDNQDSVESYHETSKGMCRICYGILRAKIFQCINGHSICDLCAVKVKVCPECRSPGVGIRNRLAESLLDDMKFECSWKCNNSLLRGELSAHEDQCDQNPQVINLCSNFISGRKCQYKFTPEWLSESKNGTSFIDHIKTCHGYVCNEDFRQGYHYSTVSAWNNIQSLEIIPSLSAQSYFKPRFYKLRNPDDGKNLVFFRIVLLRGDNQGNKILSWAFVKLSQEPTKLVMKMTLHPNTNSKTTSQFGRLSSQPFVWTMRPLSLDRFSKMVNGTKNKEKEMLDRFYKMVNGTESNEKEMSFPFSLSVGCLSKYYVSDDGNLYDTVSFETSAI